MDITKIIVTKTCFPRFSFASRNTSEIKTRFRSMMKQAGMSGGEMRQDSIIDNVSIYIYRKQGEKDKFTTEHVVKRNPDNVEESICKMEEVFPKSKDPSKIAIIVLSGDLDKEDILGLVELDDNLTIYVANVREHLNEIREELKSKVAIFSKKETLARDIDNLLESEAYKPLKSYYKILRTLLHCHRNDNPENIETPVQFETPRVIQEEAIEQLLEEIMALYDMSNIPIEKKPKHHAVSQPISNEVRMSLFKICPTIKAVGYRFRKVHVYFEEIENEKEMKERRRKITKFMDNHDIKDYSTSNVFADLKELMSTGSEIIARDENWTIKKSGSLGCFAKMETNNDKKDCILLSKHVLSNCKDVFLVKNDEEKKIGEIIESTTKDECGSLDIAAAKTLVGVDADARKLKNSDGIPRDGQLEGSMEGMNTQLTGRKVHIWGSKTKPGKGIITDSNYVLKGMKASLVEIKNEESYTGTDIVTFAKPGDSGAIVCSEDPDDEHVNAHAMLIGANTQTTYLALPLDKGVKQLEENTRKKFFLFK